MICSGGVISMGRKYIPSLYDVGEKQRIWKDRHLYIPYRPYSQGGGLETYPDSYSVVTNNKRVGGFAELYVSLQGIVYILPRNYLLFHDIFQASQVIVETIEYDLEFVCKGKTFTPDLLLRVSK